MYDLYIKAGIRIRYKQLFDEDIYHKGHTSRHAMFLVILGAVLGLVVGYRKPCEYKVIESDTSIKYNTSLDAEITYFLFENQSGCEINLNGLYQNLSTSYNVSFGHHRKELFVSLSIFCYEDAIGNDIHFNSSLESSKNQSEVKVAVQLVLRSCSVFANELKLLKHYGRIWSIVQTNTSIIHPDSNCSSLVDLQILTSHLPCHEYNNKSSVARVTRFFWEFCSKPFETVFNLELEGCFHDKYEIKQDLLQHTFPNLQTLNLKYVNLTRSFVTFPWTKVYIDTPKDKYISYLSSNFESVKKNASSFPREIIIRNSDVNIDNMNLIGNISTIRLNRIKIKSLNDALFGSITGLTLIDLSYNDLETIDPKVFKMLKELKFLYLKMNTLTVLAPGLFGKLQNLLLLDLSYNNIKFLDRNQFKYLLKLEVVNLEHNEISKLPDNFLKDQIHSIRTLKLSWNPLEMIPATPMYGDGAVKISLSHCRINSGSFKTFIDSLNHNDLTSAYVSNAVRRFESDVLPDGKYFLRRAILDLSFNQIGTIENAVTSESLMFKFQDLIKAFYVDLRGNPIDCTCMSNIPQILSETNKDSVTITNWVCMYPLELKGRLVSSITAAETYCPVVIANCPDRCSCFEREPTETPNGYNRTISTFIVDCRHINITSLPEAMPPGKLELWFQNASLKMITARDYFRNTTVLDASHNRINEITSTAVIAMTNLTSLKLDHNNLTRLPVQVISTHFRKLTLGNNPFLCDCHTRWMKTWLLKRTNPVIDWNTIECSYNTSKVNQMISVSDSFFVCQSTSEFSISEHVTFPAIVIGCTLFVLVSLSLLIYFQRFTIKVLLFMNFGIHSFDKQKHDDANMEFDALVLYSHNDDGYVRTNVVKGLLNKGYTVCNLYDDFVVGFSFLDNIEHMISKSRRIIFSMTEDTFTDDLLMSAWNIAYERAINNFTNSIILIVDREVVSKCEDMKLRKYIKSGKYIKRKSKILQSSVLYLMPKQTIDKKGEDESIEELGISMIQNRSDLENECQNNLVYITYPEKLDDEIRKQLIPELQEKNHEVRIFENEFTPGTDIRDEIHEKLDQSRHFIFILSNENIQDDVKMFILSTVISKSALCNDNYLLLFTSEMIVSSYLSNEIENYLSKYVSASMTDPEYKARLLKALK